MASADLFGDSADHPVLVANIRESLFLDAAGAARALTHRDAVAALGAGTVPILCHRKAVAQRLGAPPFRACDLLELFAFVRPAERCLPTPGGLAEALDLPRPDGLAGEARTLARAAERLLGEIGAEDDPDAEAIASFMAAAGWPWGRAVLARLARPDGEIPGGGAGLRVWGRLPEFAEHAPPPPPGSAAIEPAEARRRLARLLGGGAEDRSGQADYTSALTAAFAPRDREDSPNAVIAEAGTGVGKTLGYIAPASLWAETNGGPVWISTFTRNLQRQIDGELDRLHPDPAVKHRRVVIRKGRDNYLCLLNLEDALGRGVSGPGSGGDIALGLVARWTAATRDGDMVGGDFPAWLADLLGRRATLGLAHRRGECIYSACAHYHKCFIERTARRARRAEIVVANHALVMTLAASGGGDDRLAPSRVIFDEGHHVFDAADGAFAARLSGQEGAELRRWLRGAEDRRAGRARGLARRIEDAAMLDDALGEALAATVQAAAILPASGWNARVTGDAPRGPAEAFLAAVRRQVYARAGNPKIPYDLEAGTGPPVPGLLEEADKLGEALGKLAAPARKVAQRLEALLDEKADELDTPTRNRLDSAARGLGLRIEGQIETWRAMLRALRETTPEDFVDWFSVSRQDGRDADVAMHRHWLDPLLPFSKLVAAPSHGIVVTSATLRDATGDVEADWAAAEMRTGARHLAAPAIRVDVPSPFDYARLARVFVVTDVRKNDIDRVAAAYRALMLAAGGGTLGLFTAISRLRGVHERIAADIEGAGLALLAQHVDSLDTASLVDIFRAETDSCMLGTDAVRDGVDVPGRALRLIVFDRLPWPRPTILHRERRKAFPDIRYDDMLARLRLKQAFGRLVRKADDRGVFVLLDPSLPSRLKGAFPPDIEVERMGLAEAVAATRAFLAPDRNGMR